MKSQDGRNLRSIKSQQMIVDALIKLVKAGNLEPTAQKVADESGVGIRTVFRQFDDMENLLKAADAKLSKDYNFEITFDPTAPLTSRLLNVIKHLNSGYKKHKLIMFMTVSNMWKYKFLQENYMRYQNIIKEKTEEALPEILNLDHELRELMHATLSFAFWTRLQGQALDKHKIQRAMLRQGMMIFNQKN